MKSVFTLPAMKILFSRRSGVRFTPSGMRLLPIALLGAICGFGFFGCGGGKGVLPTGAVVSTSSIKKTGGAKITILWSGDTSKMTHALSRYIPLNAQSVRIILSGPAPGNQTPQTWAVAYSDRPTSSPADPNQQASKSPTTTENIDYLPVILLNAQIDAYDVGSAAVQQGQGTKLATATVPIQIFADERAPITVSLASTIQTIKITPTDPNVNLSANLKVGVPVRFQATAYDASGGVVPLVAGKLAWGTTNPDILLFNPAVNYDTTTGFATFTPNHFGTTQVTVTDQGSKVPGALDVTVQGNVNITPATTTLNLYQTQVFTGTVVGSTNQRVNWTIITAAGAPDPNGGTLAVVNNDGVNPSKELYTPPHKPGTYYLQALSQDDPNQPAGRAVITVQGGYGQITIDNN